MKIEKIITKQKKYLIREKPILQHLSVQRELLTYDGDNRLKMMTHATIYQRCRALLMNQAVEALILVVHSNEPITTGLPVDQIQQLVRTEETLSNSEGQSLDRQEYDTVLSFLEKIVKL